MHSHFIIRNTNNERLQPYRKLPSYNHPCATLLIAIGDQEQKHISTVQVEEIWAICKRSFKKQFISDFKVDLMQNLLLYIINEKIPSIATLQNKFKLK